MRFQGTVFSQILIKVGALFSFCGGPLILCEMLKPRVGTNVAFGVCFLPIALMIFGALCLDDPGVGGTKILLVRLGLIGSLMALAMHGYGAFILAAATARRPDHALYVIGLFIGIPTSIGFAYLAKQWLDRVRAPKDSFSPLEPR